MSETIVVCLTSLAVALTLLAVRVPIGVALGLVGFFGLAWLRNFDVALAALGGIPFHSAAKWSLTAIPMFILMGAIAHRSGLSEALFRAARLWLGNLPGGLALAANFASAGFGAASGSTMASAATMSRIAIPEMLKHGYDKGLATGSVAAAGLLSAFIPPSIIFVVYGVFAEVSISKLLIAGLIPGILTAIAYSVLIVVRCMVSSTLAPKLTLDESEDLRRERWVSLLPIWPLIVLVFGIIGGLYTGVFTPTEAGAVGVLLTMFIAAIQRRLDYETIKTSAYQMVTTTGQLLFLAIGAILYTRFLGLAGLSGEISQLVSGLAASPILLIIAVSIVYLVLGMFLDPLGILLITLPVIQPLFAAVGADPIWLGVIIVKYIEIGLLTPPVGMNVYVVKSQVGDAIPLETIFRGVSYFLVAEFFVMVLLIAFPAISLFLPRMM